MICLLSVLGLDSSALIQNSFAISQVLLFDTDLNTEVKSASPEAPIFLINSSTLPPYSSNSFMVASKSFATGVSKVVACNL